MFSTLFPLFFKHFPLLTAARFGCSYFSKTGAPVFPIYFFTEGFKMPLLLELVLLENYYEKIIPLIERGDDDRASERSIGANRNGSG